MRWNGIHHKWCVAARLSKPKSIIIIMRMKHSAYHFITCQQFFRSFKIKFHWHSHAASEFHHLTFDVYRLERFIKWCCFDATIVFVTINESFERQKIYQKFDFNQCMINVIGRFRVRLHESKHIENEIVRQDSWHCTQWQRQLNNMCISGTTLFASLFPASKCAVVFVRFCIGNFTWHIQARTKHCARPKIERQWKKKKACVCLMVKTLA